MLLANQVRNGFLEYQTGAAWREDLMSSSNISFISLESLSFFVLQPNFGLKGPKFGLRKEFSTWKILSGGDFVFTDFFPQGRQGDSKYLGSLGSVPFYGDKYIFYVLFFYVGQGMGVQNLLSLCIL